MSEELQKEIINLIKDTLSIDISVEKENDYGREYSVVKVSLYLDGVKISSESASI